MANLYVLVNPYIQGEFKNEIKANNSNEAAHLFYKNLSEHFNNAVPKFFFTIQKGGSGNGKYYHFQSKEKRKKDEVTFTIKSYKIQGENMTNFTNKLTTFKSKFSQAGGKKSSKKNSKKSKKDSSESDSDSDSDSDTYYKKVNTYIPVVNQPIYYWWYDPLIYNINSVFIPTFYAYVTPVIELSYGFP
jgi:hypothetical protein